MEYVDGAGISVPALGFGTYELTGEPCVRAVTAALEAGYRHIDTAQIYGNENEVGTAIAASGLPRAAIFLTTKIWMDRVADGALQKSVDDSLKKLKTDHVDLLLIHWPVFNVPLTDQIAALRQVQTEGKATLIGVSNYPVAMLKTCCETLDAPIVTDQVEYHPFLSQKPLLDYLRTRKMFLTAYSPLARGHMHDNPLLQAMGEKYGKTPGQITLRWLVQQGVVAAIPKAGNLEHIRSNFDIFDFELSNIDMQEIHALARPDGRIINPAWSPKWDKAA